MSTLRAPRPAVAITDDHRLRAVLASLDPRERRILELRYGLDGEQPQSLRQVGKRVGISGERVRQIESRAVRRLGATDGVMAAEWTQAKRVRRPPASLRRDALQAWTLLLLRLKPAYGYDLMKRLAHRGFEPSGPTLYRLLRDLEQNHLVRSEWANGATGPERRVYRLTKKGHRQLHDDAEGLQRHCEALQLFFTDYADVLPARGSDQRQERQREEAQVDRGPTRTT